MVLPVALQPTVSKTTLTFYSHFVRLI